MKKLGTQIEFDKLWNGAGVEKVYYQQAHHLSKLMQVKDAERSFCTLLLLLYAKRSQGQIHLEFEQTLLLKELQSYCDSHLLQNQQEIHQETQRSQDQLQAFAKSYAEKEINLLFRDWKKGLFQEMIGERGKPLVLKADKIYLQRDFRNQQIIEESIQKLASQTIRQNWQDVQKVWSDILERHAVRHSSKKEIDFSKDQKQALAQTLLMPVSIITGGPGTGKTSVAVNLLRLLKRLKQLGKFALATPTGKAGQRLFESVRQSLDSIENPTADDKNLQSELQPASTLHRLLGYSVKKSSFLKNQWNPLKFDTLIIDEVSMIDLEMMARLLDACQKGTRVILLGDADQLPPVGAGRPLEQLLQRAGSLSQEEMKQFCQIDPSLFQDVTYSGSAAIQGLVQQNLVKSHRQEDEGKFVYELACRWNETKTKKTSDAKELFEGINEIQQLTEHQWQGVALYECDLNHDELLKFAKFWSEQSPKEQFASQVLTLHREGTWGVEGLNGQFAKHYLPRGSLVGAKIMVTKNDYVHSIFNGDQGICVKKNEELHFEFEGGRLVKEQELSGWELAYAITVHKSQGSEYEHVAIILPDQMSPIFTRNALYTALTRAKKSVLLIGSKQCIPDVLKPELQ